MQLAEVVFVPDDDRHRVAVETMTRTGDDKTVSQPDTASVAVQQRGDVQKPSVGDVVLLGRIPNRNPIILGVVYPQEVSPPTHEKGERVVSHRETDSAIRYKPDGSIVIENDAGNVVTMDANGNVTVESKGGATVEAQSDGDVVINGGTTRPIIDISTTKDGDGHVTSISITRATDVFV